MLGKVGDIAGAVLSAPVDFIRGMGDGWKLGLFAAGLATVGRLTGVLPDTVTPQAIIGIGVAGTIGGGVLTGSVEMIKGFFTSKEGQNVLQDGLEQVIEQRAPSIQQEENVSHGLNNTAVKQDLDIGR